MEGVRRGVGFLSAIDAYCVILLPGSVHGIANRYNKRKPGLAESKTKAKGRPRDCMRSANYE